MIVNHALNPPVGNHEFFVRIDEGFAHNGSDWDRSAWG
jgi:hypothetical protein